MGIGYARFPKMEDRGGEDNAGVTLDDAFDQMATTELSTGVLRSDTTQREAFFRNLDFVGADSQNLIQISLGAGSHIGCDAGIRF